MDAISTFLNFKGLILAALIFIPFEHFLPFHEGQKVLRRKWLTDLAYALINSVPIGIGLTGVVAVVLIVSEILVPPAIKELVASQPYWLQVIELIILSDLGFYGAHRLFHSSTWLWRFHAVHHSIEEMDWLAAHRVHPVDQIVTKGASLIPCFALGFSEWALIVHFALYQWHSLMLHANISVNFGPLKWLVASPEFHHWHHSNRRHAHNKNFAGQLSIWDVVFGTAHMPRGEKPGDYGVDEVLPEGYVGQMIYPFGRPKGAGGAAAGAEVAREQAP